MNIFIDGLKKILRALLLFFCAPTLNATQHVIKNYSNKNNIAVKVYNKTGVNAEISPSAVVKPQHFPHAGRAEFWADEIAKFEVYEVDGNNNLINQVTTPASEIKNAPLTGGVIKTRTAFVIETNKKVVNSFNPTQCHYAVGDDANITSAVYTPAECLEKCKGYKFYTHSEHFEYGRSENYYDCSCCN